MLTCGSFEIVKHKLSRQEAENTVITDIKRLYLSNATFSQQDNPPTSRAVSSHDRHTYRNICFQDASAPIHAHMYFFFFPCKNFKGKLSCFTFLPQDKHTSHMFKSQRNYSLYQVTIDPIY